MDPVGLPTTDPTQGIRAQSLSRRFGDETAVDNIDLTVEPGHIHALVGLNGSGKSTLMRLLLGMLTPDTGSVHLLGKLLRPGHFPTDARIGQMIESPFAYPELSVRENLYITARLKSMNRAAARVSADLMVAKLELTGWRRRRAKSLSLGNRQRLGLACAMIGTPRILILDEPTNALDPAGVLLLRQLLVELAQSGCAVMVSSHHLDEVARIADQISVLHRGRYIGRIEPDGTDLERTFFDMVYAAEAK